MILDSLTYDVWAWLKIPADQLAVAMKCSAAHYDLRCQQAGQGDGDEPAGFLYTSWHIANNYAKDDADYMHKLTWSQLDTLSKILEVGTMPGVLADERRHPDQRRQENAAYSDLRLGLEKTFRQLREVGVPQLDVSNTKHWAAQKALREEFIQS